MLPQVDSQVLSSNAQFALLVKDLHSAKLNQDGTSKIVDKTGLKERQASQEVRVFQHASLDDRRYR